MLEKKSTEKRVSREKMYNGKIFNVYKDIVELSSGVLAQRDVIEHEGAAAVIALSSDNDIIMVRQYRIGSKEEMLELPAGKIDAGEKPETTAKRELEEETGLVAKSMELLTELYTAAAYCTEKIYIYTTGELEKGKQNLDEDELLSVEYIPINRAVEMCLNQEIKDSKTLIGILTYVQKYGLER